jgi:hypothetical protein
VGGLPEFEERRCMPMPREPRSSFGVTRATVASHPSQARQGACALPAACQATKWNPKTGMRSQETFHVFLCHPLTYSC